MPNMLSETTLLANGVHLKFLVAIAMVGLVIDDDHILEPQQLAASALQHLPFGLDRAAPALRRRNVQWLPIIVQSVVELRDFIRRIEDRSFEEGFGHSCFAPSSTSTLQMISRYN